MGRTIIIVVLALLGIFVHPFSPGTIDFIYRFLIFSALTYLVYLNFRTNENEPESEPALQNYTPPGPKSDIDIEIKEDISFLGVLNKDSRTQEFIKAQFEILNNILVAENGWIFYKNNPETMVSITNVYGRIEKSTEDPEKTYPITGLMQILDADDKVLIENNLNNDTPLLSYYLNMAYKPFSFIGIPLHLFGEEKLFFVFDSPNKDHFNHEDKDLVEKIRETTRIFLINRMKGYTLLSSLRSKDSLLEFAITLNGSKTVSHAINKLAEYVSELFEATRMTICLRKSESESAIIKKVVGQTNDIDENFEFPLDQGLTGWVIGKNKPYLIEDLEKGEYFIPRYTKDEKTNFGLRSFIGIPLQTTEKVYGALTLEHITPGKFTENDKHRIQQITDIFSSTFLRQQS
jgi:transcriptional regulator with GAF, ATPase, and Fis domain